MNNIKKIIALLIIDIVITISNAFAYDFPEKKHSRQNLYFNVNKDCKTVAVTPPNNNKFESDYWNEDTIGDVTNWRILDFEDYQDCPLNYSDGNLYLNGVLEKDFINPEGLTKSNAFAFANAKCIKSVVLPSTLAEIGDKAFNYVNIPNISTPSSVKKNGELAFPGIDIITNYSSVEGASWGANSNNSGDGVFESCLSYFEDNILNIDPIEGYYEVTMKMIIKENSEYRESTNSTRYFVKEKADGQFYIFTDENLFFSENPSNFETEMRLYKIGNNDYGFKDYVGGFSDYVATSRVSMETLMSFSVGYQIPDSFIKEKMGQDPRYVQLYGKLEFRKLYPTLNMYKDAIENNKSGIWTGTGFAIGNKYIVTNYHVVKDAEKITLKCIKGDLYTSYSALVVATDMHNDIAILMINDSRYDGRGAIPFSISSRMAEVGEDVFVLGYPMTQSLGDEIKLTNGIVSSRTGFQGDVSTYQITAPLQPGNSGGPLFDKKGNVIGIVNAGIPGAENVGYAIKTSYLKNLIESAGLNVTLPSNNTISNLSLSEKVKRLKNFVFYIECSK